MVQLKDNLVSDKDFFSCLVVVAIPTALISCTNICNLSTLPEIQLLKVLILGILLDTLFVLKAK